MFGSVFRLLAGVAGPGVPATTVGAVPLPLAASPSNLVTASCNVVCAVSAAASRTCARRTWIGVDGAGEYSDCDCDEAAIVA